MSAERVKQGQGLPNPMTATPKSDVLQFDFPRGWPGKAIVPRNREPWPKPASTKTWWDSLICKRLGFVGTQSGRTIAEDLCLSFGIIEERFLKLRGRQLLTHRGAAPLNDYFYALTDQGREYTKALSDSCAYHGPAPVPLSDYITSVDAQTISAEVIKRKQLQQAFQDILVNKSLFDQLGPAVNSGAGLFLYGAPGNGKTTLAERITLCFGQNLWIPKAIIVEGEILKFFDSAYHAPVPESKHKLLRNDSTDQRWSLVRRPTVVIGGELTMDNLEIRHNPHTNISEAPLQMKSNCGSLLIDDFGRQRMSHVELLNRCDRTTGKASRLPDAGVRQEDSGSPSIS